MEKLREREGLVRTTLKRTSEDQLAVPEPIPGFVSPLHIKTTINEGGEIFDDHISYKRKSVDLTIDPFEVVYLCDSGKKSLKSQEKKLKKQGFEECEINKISLPDGKGGKIKSHVLLAVKPILKEEVLSHTTAPRKTS